MPTTTRKLAAPSRSDVGLMLVFLVPSLAQVLLDPIASRPVGVLFACGSVLPLAWRRSHPVAAAIAGSAAWLIPTQGFLFLGYAVAVILFFSAGAHVALLSRVAALAGWGLAMGTAGVLRGPEHPVALLGAWLVVIAPIVAGRLVAQQRAQTRRLQELTAQLEHERALAKRSAAAEERARIARELHDVVGHEVTLIAIQSEAAASALRSDPDRAVDPIEAIRQTAHRTGAEMRAILGLLRAEDGDVAPMPPRGPLAWLASSSGLGAWGWRSTSPSTVLPGRRDRTCGLRCTASCRNRSPMPVVTHPDHRLRCW